jgi:hypothetical protein
MYSHGHAIGRTEAKDIGLPVSFPEKKMEDAIWHLYLQYENLLTINDSIYPEIELATDEEKTLTDVPLAIIQSANLSHVFKTNINLKKERNIPSSPAINLNINLQLPPNIQPNQLPQQAQQVLQELVNQVSRGIPLLVQQEIIRQSPVKGIGARLYGGKWSLEM